MRLFYQSFKLSQYQEIFLSKPIWIMLKFLKIAKLLTIKHSLNIKKANRKNIILKIMA